jgi:hypothetical protein
LSEGELVEPVRIPFDEAVSLVANGHIDDAKSVAAILLANLQRQSTERRQ